jgi:hypothetical protein
MQFPIQWFLIPECHDLCDYRWGMDWWTDLLTACTHHHCWSPQHLLSFFPAIAWQRFLNSEDSSSSVLMSLLSSEYSTTELLSTVNSTIAAPLLSPLCRARLDCQPSTELSHSPSNYFISLHSTELLNFIVFKLTPRHGPRTTLLCVSRSVGTCLLSHYQATCVLSCDCCIATVLQITLWKGRIPGISYQVILMLDSQI